MSSRFAAVAVVLALSLSAFAALPARAETGPEERLFEVSPAAKNLLKIRDPFRKPEIKSAESQPLSELEVFPLDQFKMTGFVSGPDRPKAMLVGPNGKTYFVAEKMRIGVRKGIVKKITEESIMVREKFVNIFGQEEEADSIIKLSAESSNGG